MAKRIVVIGAGIIGCSIAFHLAKAGANVLVLDAGNAPGGVATPNSWAWINASWGNPEPYFRLRQRSIAAWRGLGSVLPELDVNWCGSVGWDLPDVKLQNYIKSHRDWGYSLEEIDGGRIRALEPHLAQVPELAAYAPGEGMVEPVAAANCFMAAAVALGAEVISNCSVVELKAQGDRVVGVKTSRGDFLSDEVIVAAGGATPPILQTIGLSLDITAPAGLLAHSKPAPKLLNGMVLTPRLHIRQTAQGQLVAGSDFGGAQPGEDPQATADALFFAVQDLVLGADQLELDFYTLGYRPTPRDGFPAIGRLSERPGLFVAVMHSGVTLAPIVGEFVAAEILDDQRDELLQPYHPDRLIVV